MFSAPSAPAIVLLIDWLAPALHQQPPVAPANTHDGDVGHHGPRITFAIDEHLGLAKQASRADPIEFHGDIDAPFVRNGCVGDF